MSTSDLSSAIAAFFDGAAPAAADNGGGGAAPPTADAALEPGFGGGGACAVVGDLGWDLTADLESAVAIAVGICSMRVGRGGGVGMARSDLNWWVRCLGANLGHLVANLRWIWWDLWRFWIDRQVWNLVFGLIWEWGDEISPWERR